MNKQDEEKAKEIADKYEESYLHYDVELESTSHITSYTECFKSCLEMAAWKEQQMIEKFTKFLETNSYIENNRYLCIDSNKDIRFVSGFIEYFKNYMSND